MGFLIQHIEAIVLVVLGLVLLVGFLQQFGVVQGRGLVALIAGLAALFGWTLFQHVRRQRIEQKIVAKRKELEEQEAAMDALQQQYDLSVEQLQAQKTALADARRMYLKRLAEVEAANEAALRQRLEEIERMPPDELADALTRFALGENG